MNLLGFRWVRNIVDSSILLVQYLTRSYTLLAVFCLAFHHSATAQPYGNEWIEYDQEYFKFQVTSKGVYRITSSALTNAGVPISSIDPRNFQLFGRGEEQYIYVSGESDGSIDPGDYIEFYAEGNDGWLDERLYGSAEDHPNPYYSLINDTATYYLTWNNSVNNRRMSLETDVNFSAFATSSFFWRESLQDYHTTYFDGKTNLGSSTDAEYVSTEGWFDGPINLGGSRVKNISTTRVYTSGPSARVKWTLVGASNHPGTNPDHHLNVEFASTVYDTLYEGYEKLSKSFNVPAVNLGGVNTSFTFRSINDLGSAADRSAIAFISVTYPHTTDMGNATSFELIVDDHPTQNKTRLDLTSFNSFGSAWVYDLQNHRRISTVPSGTNLQVLIPNGGSQKKCFLIAESLIGLVNDLSPVNGNGTFTNYINLDRDSAFIIVTNPALQQSASMYESYRNSKGMNAIQLNVKEMYDQFGYGINTHPLALRGGIDYILDNWASPPQNLFFFGKSIRARLCRKSSVEYAKNLVPSMGNPASDIMITAGLNGTILEPPIPTGRLSALDNDQGMWYLNKVIEYESNTVAEWMKTILHFAGGKSKIESDRFSAYLKGFESIMEDTLFGGFVHTFKKSTTAPIQITLSDSIEKLINQGVSIMTFFGHSSASGGFDQNIDNPTSYSNKGKYPVLVANSCFAGDIHGTSAFSTSEQFVLVKDRGMIGFIASTDLGFESLLNLYSGNLFQNIGQTNYGGSLGQSMKNTILAIQGNGSNSSIRSICYEMTLHGDPSIKVNSQSKPDYEITESSIFFDPAEVTAERDSFSLNVIIKNLGRATNQPIVLSITRNFPNNLAGDTTIELSIPGVRFRDTIFVNIPVDAINGDGLNRFEVTVDAFDVVQELREDNNFVNIDLFIRSGNLVPVMPYEYAIIPEQSPTLIASTGYPFEEEQQYKIELDTTDQFNSSFLQSTTISQEGGVIKWKPSVLNSMPEDQVYFWRTARTTSDPAAMNWKESSFQYVPGKRGWSQDHFFQFKNDEYLFLNPDRNQRRFNFDRTLKRLSVVTISTQSIGFLFNVDFKIDADRIEFGGCGLGAAIHIAVLDSLNFEPWGTPFNGLNAANDFGQLNKNGNCGKNRVQNFFIFNANNPSHLAGLKDMLQNKVPDGHYVLAYTWVRNDFSRWDAIDPGMRQVFVDMGASEITNISNDTLPYIFFVQKGKPSTVRELVGTGPDEFITLNANLQNNTTFGSIGSTVVGPASSWDSLVWNYNSLEVPTRDQINLRLNAVDQGLNESTLIQEISSIEKRISISTVANPTNAPYLKLYAQKEDDSLQTPPQLDKWQVYYEGVPELAINPNIQFDFYADTLQEGDLLRFSVAIENISDYETDSLLIHYYVLDRNRKRHDIPYARQRAVKADSVFISTVEYSTLNLVGLNTFVIEINPNNDQPEQYHFNNIGQIPFFVTGDNSNPLMEVTFDGIRILDGDIVSPETEIVIQLSDENQYLALDDTADFRVWLTDPSGMERQIHFLNNSGSSNMQFVPGSLPKNTAKIVFAPDLKQDGIYKLRVQASDKSKNESGDIDYEISFEVISRSTITNVINYPNPFTTSTRFVFVLTGSKIPDAIQIQIMTVTGKLVKTIDAFDIGPINIGRNITEYAWDGNDDYGDRLANGVYLYRVKAQINGENIEQRATSADKYFKKGFGKMYLMK